jgi:hypothetical protein
MEPLSRCVTQLERDETTDRCSYACQGVWGSGSSRRLVIFSARYSALARDRPVVVMTLLEYVPAARQAWMRGNLSRHGAARSS